MSPFDLLLALAWFTLLAGGPGWLVARHLRLEPAENLLAAVVVSLGLLWLVTWGLYVFRLPARLLWVLPLLGVLGLGLGWRDHLTTARDPSVRFLLIGQISVTLWCVGCLAFVLTYSGGGWSGDWLEHWERTRFFFDRTPGEPRFLNQYTLPARPPLVNVLVSAWLGFTSADFAHYQLFTTLLGSLVYLPAALLAARFAGHAGATLALVPLLLLNPLFVQNATFAWTKLAAAFFALTAVVFFLRRLGPNGTRADALLVSVSLAAGLLAHFSVGPYLVVLGIAWLGATWQRRTEADWWRDTALAGALGVAWLATWFGWSVARFGSGATFYSNSSVTAAAPELSHQVGRFLLNVRDTIVPHFLRHPDPSVVHQANSWGSLRDWFFQLYQLNLLFAFGSIGGFVLLRELALAARRPAPHRTTRLAWAAAIAGTVLLGVAVHAARDDWGLVHICLQPLVLLGLAYLAARWSTLTRPWRLALIAGLVVDGVCGVVLHLAVENYALDRWFPDGRTFDRVMLSYTDASRYNIIAKAQQQLGFFADVFTVPPVVTLAVLVLILVTAVIHVRRTDAMK